MGYRKKSDNVSEIEAGRTIFQHPPEAISTNAVEMRLTAERRAAGRMGYSLDLALPYAFGGAPCRAPSARAGECVFQRLAGMAGPKARTPEPKAVTTQPKSGTK